MCGHVIVPDKDDKPDGQQKKQEAQDQPEALDVVLLPFFLGSRIIPGDELIPFPDQNDDAHDGQDGGNDDGDNHNNHVLLA